MVRVRFGCARSGHTDQGETADGPQEQGEKSREPPPGSTAFAGREVARTYFFFGSTIFAGSGLPSGTKRIDTEFTQWRVFFVVMRSPVNTWPR